MNDENNKDEQVREGIYENGMIKTKNKRGNIQCLNIIGAIEGHNILNSQSKTTKYEHILPQLVAVEEDEETDGLLILLNTVGGDVEAGLAMAEMIAGMKKPTVSLVLGGGHSIGVPLAVAARESFIVESATMTIHPMRVNGLVIGVMQTFRYFQRIQEQILSFVVRHSDITLEELKNKMLATDEIANDVGTVLFGKEAVECGIIDKVGSLSDALEALYSMIEKEKNKK